MNNKKVLSKAVKNLSKTKKVAKPKNIIEDPRGQWAHPGEITRIPSDTITMQGVPYPVMAYPNIGQPQMMYPGQEYYFPGADHVDEYPQMQDGGIISQEEIDAANRAMMKARLAYAQMHGNPAAQRMVVAPDQPYQFDNGMIGTHYMASMDNYAVPQIQGVDGQLVLGDFGPESAEAMRFDSPEDAIYFAENYKQITPDESYRKENPEEDYIEAELTEEEIQEYAKGGWVVEEIDEISAPTDLDPKTMAKYKKALKNQENAGKAGYNKAQDRWYPHVSPEGGKKTIGYGHKLTTNNYANGLSTAEVESLLDSDILKHQAIAEKQVDEQYGKGTFDKLPQDSQMLLVDYAYNLGTLKEFPKFVNGVVTGDKEKMLAEHKRYSGSSPITRRNQWTADTINTMDTTIPSKINLPVPTNSTQTTKSNKDRWGRSPNTIWYGFNPETKLYEQKGLLWPQYGDPGPGIGGPLPGSYISPGQRLREYQEGLKKQSKGGQYQDGGSTCPPGYTQVNGKCIPNSSLATFQDSLNVYNMQMKQNAYYNKYKDVFDTKIIPNTEMWPASERHENRLLVSGENRKDTLTTLRIDYKSAMDLYSSYMNAYNNAGDLSSKEKEKYKKNMLKKANEYKKQALDIKRAISEMYPAKNNKFYYKDLIPGAIDPNAPTSFYDTRIEPQGLIERDLKPNKYQPGAMVTTNYYDPIAIKPAKLLTDAEIKTRFEKYGAQGIPKSRLEKLGLKETSRSTIKNTSKVEPKVEQEIQESIPVREKEEPIPTLKPGLIDIPKKDLIGEYQPYDVPEYTTPGYKKDYPYLYFVHHNSNQIIPHPRPRIGKALKTTPINKIVQKVTGYDPEAMEGFYDEEGNWIPGEIEQAQQEGRQIDFQGLSSLRDKRDQETYNTEYNEYLKNMKYAQMLTDGLRKRGYIEDNTLSKNKRQKGGQYNIGDEVELTEAEVKRLRSLGYTIEKI